MATIKKINIGGTQYDLTASNIAYGTCSTAAGTAAKAVVISAGSNWALAAGAIIIVKFSNANTVANATLNVNSSGAKAIYHNGAAIATNIIKAGNTATFVYNGTQYELIHIDALTVHTHSASYTPAGSVSQPTFTGTAVNTEATSGTTTVYSITNVGTLPSHTYTAPSMSATIANKCLILTFSAGSHDFSAGSLPTKGSGVSVATGAHTHSVTAAGTVSKPSFTGTAATITVGKPSY